MKNRRTGNSEFRCAMSDTRGDRSFYFCALPGQSGSDYLTMVSGLVHFAIASEIFSEYNSELLCLFQTQVKLVSKSHEVVWISPNKDG